MRKLVGKIQTICDNASLHRPPLSRNNEDKSEINLMKRIYDAKWEN